MRLQAQLFQMFRARNIFLGSYPVSYEGGQRAVPLPVGEDFASIIHSALKGDQAWPNAND